MPAENAVTRPVAVSIVVNIVSNAAYSISVVANGLSSFGVCKLLINGNIISSVAPTALGNFNNTTVIPTQYQTLVNQYCAFVGKDNVTVFGAQANCSRGVDLQTGPIFGFGMTDGISPLSIEVSY